MSLSEQEILEVQESWEHAKALGIDTIARIFYERVFSQAPEVLEMFSFKNDENMYESASFKRHSRGILMTVGRCVAGLKDLETITPTLVTLGARHNKYVIKNIIWLKHLIFSSTFLTFTFVRFFFRFFIVFFL